MATIEVRKNADGKITSYRVEWYDGGVRRRQTLPTELDATRWKNLLEAVKHDTKAAETALLRQISRSPTFREVAEGHIERLINVREYTTKRYGSYVKNHLGEPEFVKVNEASGS